ncbi:MAG: UDP-N-acetylmuramoyl-L-alanine--D-glutamate ligase [Candidatus Omnitrophota bacterium]
MDVKGKKILVVGLGSSGFSSAALLLQKGAKVKVTDASDSEEIKRKSTILRDKGAHVETGGHTKGFCAGHELVVMSPGVDRSILSALFEEKKDISVIGEMELGYLFCKAPITAITGTNGKTTVTSLMGDIIALSGKHTIVCGNIGNPLAGEIGGITENSAVVLEVSSFQLEGIRSFRPRTAVLLNVTDDHYDRHGGFRSYKEHKFSIFSRQGISDNAVLHSDLRRDPLVRNIKSKIFFYGDSSCRYTADKGSVIFSHDGKSQTIITDKDTSLRGKHNMENIACCCQVAEIEGISLSAVKKAVKNFRGLEHRFQEVGTFGGVVFIDDSKATNVDAAKRALESVDKRVVLIVGGRDKLGNYGALVDLVKKKVAALVVIGEARERIKRTFSDHAKVYEAGSMEEAVEISVSAAKKGEAVMLSPMCSSFDMFDSYAHRGRVFRESVRRICVKNGIGSNEK